MKRAQVAFHRFAAMGEPEKALAKYSGENLRRGALLRANLDSVGEMTPFLEIGANAGHTSYLFANEFESDGFALDLSEDALRVGQQLPEIWGWARSPVLIAGDAVQLPFRDGSLRFVATFQTLSQFQDIDAVLREVLRVLQPGGVFFMAEEPVRRRLTLRLLRVPYVEQMKPWELALHRRGLLDFIARDVIGAAQEESFGIRQNHRFGIREWSRLLSSHFTDVRLVTFARESGWANERTARLLRRFASEGTVVSMLGGTLAAFCRKAGAPEPGPVRPLAECLACPECKGNLAPASSALECLSCSFLAECRSGVFNLLRSDLKSELFPTGWRPDTLDFSSPEHERGLVEGFHELEGEPGAKFRWIGSRAVVRLQPTAPERSVLRIRGYAHPDQFAHGRPKLRLNVNGRPAGEFGIHRQGLFIIETALVAAPEYVVEIHASPVWLPEGEDRQLTVSLSAIRLLPPE